MGVVAAACIGMSENRQNEESKMKAKRFLSAGAAMCAALALVGCGEKQISYKADVAPILGQYCTECHTPPAGDGFVKSGQDLSSYDGLMKGTKFGATVKPKDSFTSALVMMIEGRVAPSIRMPHGKGTIPKDKIETITKWIDQGAKDN